MASDPNPYAFPSPDDGRPSDGYGMELRDWFAGQAMSGLLNGATGLGRMTPAQRAEQFSMCADILYEFADAMLAERAKRQPTPTA